MLSQGLLGCVTGLQQVQPGGPGGVFLDKLKTWRFRTSHKSTDTRNKAQYLVGLF